MDEFTPRPGRGRLLEPGYEDPSFDSVSLGLLGAAVVFGGSALKVGAIDALLATKQAGVARSRFMSARKETSRIIAQLKARIPTPAAPSDIYQKGLIGEVTGLQASLDEARIGDQVQGHLQRRYGSVGDSQEITVGKVLDEIQRATPDTSPSGVTTYSIFGGDVSQSEAIALRRLADGDNAILSRNMVVDQSLFLHEADNTAYKIFGAHTITDVASLFNIPGFGNPLDIFLKGDRPITQRVAPEHMLRFGSKRKGVVVGEELFEIAPDRSITKVDDIILERPGSSAAKSRRFTDPTMDNPRPFRTDDAHLGLIETGFYNHPLLERIFKPILQSDYAKKTFGEQSFVFRPSADDAREIIPLTAKYDMWAADKPILSNFSSRFVRDETFFKTIVKDPIERLKDKTALYPTTPTAGARDPSFVERVLNVFSAAPLKKHQYTSLTPEQAAQHYMDTAQRVNLGAVAGEAGGLDNLIPNQFGKIAGDATDIDYLSSVGADVNMMIRPKFVPFKKSLSDSISGGFMQAMNTTMGLFERMTGIGMKGTDPASVIKNSIIAATAAYVVADGLGFFDYMLEKDNPFGDVGVKKTALYGYAAAKTAQQAVLNTLSPIFDPLEYAAPGVTDSLLGHGARGLGGAVGGAAIGRRFGKYGGLIGGVLGGLFAGTSEVYKDPTELWDEYMGNKLVDVRESRFWMLGPQDWRGGDVKYRRKSLLAMELDDDRYEHYGGKGMYYLTDSTLTSPLRMFGGITGIGEATKLPGLDPYAVERRNYYNQQYPVTGNMFENVPIIGPALGSTIGQAFKPTKLMHVGAMRQFYNNQNSQNTQLQDIASQLGQEMTHLNRSMPRMRGVGDNVGESLDNLMDFFGLRGFMLSSIKGAVTGNRSFTAQDLYFKDAGEMTNISDRFYEGEYGGALGLTELPRRLLTRNNAGDLENPLDPMHKNQFYSFDRQLATPGMPMGIMGGTAGFNPGSGQTVDNLYSWNLDNKAADILGIPYLSSKMYSNKTPLDLYRRRVTNSDDFQDWNNPYETIAKPYFQNMRGEGPLTGGVMGGAAYFLGRSAQMKYLLGTFGAMAGMGIGSVPAGISGDEDFRRSSEEMFDYYKTMKIERLKGLAKSNQRGDLLLKLSRLGKGTMAGLDYSQTGTSFLSQAYFSLPKKERRFLMDFANAPLDQRQDIEDSVPDYYKSILRHVWSSQQGEVASNRGAVRLRGLASKYKTPSDSWAGWDAGIDMNKVKLASVFSAGKDVHDFGFWGSDERDMKRNYNYMQKQATLPNTSSQAFIASLLSKRGGSVNVDYSAIPDTMESSYSRGEYTNDRSNQLMGLMTNGGRF